MKTDSKNPKRPNVWLSVILPGVLGCPLGCCLTLFVSVILVFAGVCLMPFNTATLGGSAAFLIIFSTAIIARVLGKRPPVLLFLGELAAVVIALNAFFAHDTPKYIVRTYFIDPIPESLHIRRAYWEPHPTDPSAWVYFTATPADIQRIITTNCFLLQTNADRDTWQSAPQWWGPQHLRNPVLFNRRFPYSDRTNMTAYIIGLWVNDETNEAMGCYISF